MLRRRTNMLTAERSYSSLASLISTFQKQIAVAVASVVSLLTRWSHFAAENLRRGFRGARHGSAVVARWCGVGWAAAKEGTRHGLMVGMASARFRADAMAQWSRRAMVRIAQGSRAMASVTAQWARAAASVTAEGLRVALRATAQWTRAAAQGSRAMLLRAAPQGQRLGTWARESWRRYVGVSADEFVIDVDADDDFVPTEILRFPSQLPPPPLPPLPAPSRYSSDDLVPENSGEFDRISQICSPAVVRLARTSGFEARAHFSAPSSERTSEVGQRRKAAS